MLDDVLWALGGFLLTPSGPGRASSGRRRLDEPQHARRLRKRFDRGGQVVVPAYLAPNSHSFARRGHLRVKRGARSAWHDEGAPRTAWRDVEIVAALGESVIRHEVDGIRFKAQGWTVRDGSIDGVVLLDGPYGQRFAGALAR